MRQSILFTKTTRESPADEVSVNAKLLIRAGLIDKVMSGVYSFLPLGLRVLKKIEELIRREMNAVKGQEVFLPSLHPKENWDRTGRWRDPGREVMFQFSGRADREYGLGWTHEEIIVPLMKKFVSSYRDLPVAVYQIQNKFRDEPRAKSGLLRGREFLMKDLYSFHRDEADLAKYYDTMKGAYQRIFKNAGLNPILTEASGGAFSKFSHEFQVPTPAGEDIIMRCTACEFSRNREIANLQNEDKCPKCKGSLEALRAIEVGNIFELKTRFSKVFNLTYRDERGESKFVQMGCYGIGLGRTLGAIAEVSHDESGLIWPGKVAPYCVHLLALQDSAKVSAQAETLFSSLQKQGIEVLYDDRKEASAGEKLADADLIGIPLRLIVSEKTLARSEVEFKERKNKEVASVKNSLAVKRAAAIVAKFLK